MANMMQTRRKIKNTIKNYSDAQKKVRDATSNDPWGPSSTLMSDIADATYNVMAFGEIMQMIWKRLNDHGKNWRHVYKSLVLLEYILKTGSEKVQQQCKENIFAIQTLKDFQYMEENKDQGMNVREKAKQLVSLLRDDERLKNERTKALKAKERFAQNSMGISSRGGEQTGSGSGSSGGVMFGRGAGSGSAPSLSSGSGGYSDPYGGATGQQTDASGRRLSADLEQARPSTAGEEELQLQLALAISKEEHDQAEQQRRGDQVRLQMAVEESKKLDDPTLVDLLDAVPPQPQAKPEDPWGVGQEPAAKTDPWTSQPSNTSQGGSDPWVSGSAAPKPDPWAPPAQSSSHSTPLSTPGQPTDPWGTTPATASNHSSPWSSPAMGTSTNHTQSAPGFDAAFTAPQPPANSLDDAFDKLSTRPTGSATSPVGEIEHKSQNGQTSSSPNPFDYGGLGEGLDGSRKTPEDFLGANKNLVNLDNLVGRPQSVSPSGPTNPFMTTAPPSAGAQQQQNPFAAQQQQQRVPLNQLQAQSTMGFTQPSQSLPNPLIPVGNQPQPMMGGNVQVQAQGGYNPFM